MAAESIADSNLALFGTEVEINIKKAAAEGEPQWDNAGKAAGIQIWRIEKFRVVPWPTEETGSFYNGDSYIVLKTTELEGGNLKWDVHFWLGTNTTQDEAGTAAYKTVELDDVLGGSPVQHREVQGFETKLFLSYFPQMYILEGGIDSGFRHVEPEAYQPRLLQVKGAGINVKVKQIQMSSGSMNSGDVFILDMGTKVIQWNGSSSGPFEKNKGAEVARSIADDHNGELTVYDEGDDAEDLWATVGSKDDVKGEADVTLSAFGETEHKLFRMSDESGSLEVTEVATGAISKDQLEAGDAFLLDVGYEVCVWVGSEASKQERQMGLHHAQQYLKKVGHPICTPISCMFQGAESAAFHEWVQ